MNQKKSHLKWLLILGISFSFLTWFLTFRDIYNFIPEVNVGNHRLTPSQSKQLDATNIYTLFGNGTNFVYFTIQTNIMLGLGFIVAFFIKNKKVQTLLISVLVMDITVVMVVFWTMIAPFLVWFYLWFSIENVILHGVIPIIAIIFWFKYKKEKIDYKWWWISLIYPVIYLFMLLGLYYYPSQQIAVYPFSHFNEPMFWKLSKVWVIILDILIFLGIGAIFAALYVFVIWTTRQKWSNNVWSKNS